jgi:hypothetical protein
MNVNSLPDHPNAVYRSGTMKPLLLGIGCAALVLQAPAAAQAPGPKPEAWSVRDATLIVAAERLFGLHAYRIVHEPEDGSADYEFGGTMLSVLSGHSAINDKRETVNPYAVPRIGADAVLGKSFTLGGNLGFATSSGTLQSGDSSEDLVDTSSFALGARLGYLLVPNETIAIWLRGGPEYFSTSRDDTNAGRKVTSFGVALSLDPQLVLTPVPHAAILVGPLIGVGLWGKSETSDGAAASETTTRTSSFGATGGLALIF